MNGVFLFGTSEKKQKVSFSEKPNSPICNLLSGTDGLALNTQDSHMVLTLAIRLLGDDDPRLR